MNEAPSHWIKQLEESVQAMQEVPLWGAPPSFPWKQLEKELAACWQIDPLTLSAQAPKWRTREELTEGFGSEPIVTPFALTPLEGRALLLLSAEDSVRLGKAALAPNTLTRGFSDPSLQRGFFAFLLLNAAAVVNRLAAFGDLTLVYGESNALPEEGAITCDIRVKAGEHSFWVRLLCSQCLQKAFRAHFARTPPLLSLSMPKSLALPIHFLVGSTTLSLASWQEIKQGDLLLLDRCTYDPKAERGSVELTLNSTPLFHARFKEGGVKILDYALYYEEEKTTMTDEDDRDEFPEEESDEELFDDDEDGDEEGEETDPGEEDAEEGALWNLPPPEESGALEKRVAASDLSLTVSVEIARLTVPVERLLALKPGNEIPLAVRPEQGVHLLISGKRVAKGELIKVGETLGVRILEIGE